MNEDSAILAGTAMCLAASVLAWYAPGVTMVLAALAGIAGLIVTMLIKETK